MVKQLEPGDPVRIGRYRLLGQLGAGGMGRVLLGIGPDGRLVAVKQIHTHLVHEEDFLPRFRREVQTSARVSGAYTAAVIDFDVDAEMPWLASVFVPGVPLDRAVEQFGPLSTQQVRTLAVGLSSALHAIHGVGLIHRDLKPANVILAEDGPRVIDFGIARAAEEHSELTHTGSIIGSPAFMSPEQAQSMPLTPASDVFSFGAVLAMAAGGISIFAGSSMPHTLYNIVHTEPDLDGLPAEVQHLVEPCLRKDPGARPTAAEILDFLGPLPPQAYPWSVAVHEAIRAQTADLSVLSNDPESTRIIGADEVTLPEPSFDERLRRLEAQAHAESYRRRRRQRWRLAALAGAVSLVIAAIGAAVVISRDGDVSNETNPLGGLDLTALRSTDLCEVMRDPLVRSAENWTVESATPQWGTCAATSGSSRYVAEVGRTEAYRDAGRRSAGVPVLDEISASNGVCARALRPAAMDPQFGLVVRVTGTESADGLCAIADEATTQMAQRMKKNPPKLPNIRNSLARLDPCALVAPIEIQLSVGPKVPGTPEQSHSCTWFGTNALTLTLERTKKFTDAPKSIPFDAGGRVVYLDGEELTATTCVRRYTYRSIDADNVEAVRVQTTNPSMDHPETKCLAAQSVLDHIVANLPQVN
ncbi:serine/threonine-protein kinase [Nocardia sp. NPDC005366]|uniref:serine/threonine-protein kinase n=1 Tax=Nocardia sp. NPDC005366 TaxID=3156878 RepID=UPI0033A4D50F